MGYDLTELLDLGPPSIPATMSEPELAALLGISASRIRTLARDGVMARTAPGRYDVRQSIANYVERLSRHAKQAGRPSEGGDALKRARTHLAEEQAKLAALKVAQANGDLVSVAEVKREWVTAATDLRNAVLTVPGRLQTRLGLSVEQTSIADEEIRLALEALADG